MSADQIARLEALLARVQKNSAQPRPVRPALSAAAATEPAPEPEPAHPVEPMLEPEPLEPVAAEEVAIEMAEPEIVSEAPAIEMGVESIEDLDLLDDDIVDITDTPSAAPEAAFAAEEPEEPPASSRRPRAAANMTEALEGVADQLDLEGRQIPIVTPPPESGPQAAPPVPPMVQPPPPADLARSAGMDDLLDDQFAPPLGGPTPEQLGGTVELEAGGASLEIDEPDFQESAPPPQSSPRATSRPLVAPEPEPIEAELVARPIPPPDQAPAAFASRSFRPETFIELLEASLSLGA
ncbi:MAG: hypothetical protein KF718_00250 [Polyangiaceae bacterium]|nr:hypothetical protein [Polyangiaceae bacterium]